MKSESLPSQVSSRTRQSQPSASAGIGRVITKAQFDILLLSQRRSKVSDAQFKTYLAETYHVAEPKEIKQKDLNQILEWLDSQEAERMEAEERQAAAVNN